MTTVDKARAALFVLFGGHPMPHEEAAIDALIAAVRAEYEADADGFSPGCGPFNHPLTCKCPFVHRAERVALVATPAEEELRAEVKPLLDYLMTPAEEERTMSDGV